MSQTTSDVRSALENYAENISNTVQNKMDKLMYTQKLTKVIRNNQENWNYNQTTFDQNRTTLDIDSYSLTMIGILFPNLEKIKLILKAKSDLNDHLFQDLRTFKKLKGISLTITDGVVCNPRTTINIPTLKVYFKTLCAKDNYLKALFKKITNLENLTLNETDIPQDTMKLIENQPIRKLTIKNAYIDKKEALSFMQVLYSFKLKKLKLIYTQINDIEAEQMMFYVIKNYLTHLPHGDLEELSITLPSLYEKIDYQAIIKKLNKLTKLELFLTTNNNFNNINQLFELLNAIPFSVKTTVIYYRTERTPRTHVQDVEILSNFYNHIKVIELVNPFITFPNLPRIDQCKRKMVLYNKLKYTCNEIKPYKEENPIIIHNIPNLPFNSDDIDIEEFLNQTNNENLEPLDLDNIDVENEIDTSNKDDNIE